MRSLACILIGHNFAVLRFITKDITEFRCTRCRYEIATNYELKISVELKPDIKEMHSALALATFILEERKEAIKKSLCEN
jgi:hypothetical protein